VSLSEPLQPLQLVHGLEELAIYRGLIAHESIDRRALKGADFREVVRFMESRYTDPPVFVRNLLHQNFFQRADRFQVLLQAAQQAGELFLVPAIQKRASLLESRPCRVLFQELMVLPCDVFGPVDFCAFLRLAAILRGEDLFVPTIRAGAGSTVTATGTIDSLRFDSDRVCSASD
jgi:hypothetical protein